MMNIFLNSNIMNKLLINKYKDLNYANNILEIMNLKFHKTVILKYKEFEQEKHLDFILLRNPLKKREMQSVIKKVTSPL